MASVLEHRGYLLHLTHYDPPHVAGKAREAGWEPAVARRVVDAAAEAGFNLLLVGVSDGIEYASHPELKRHYSRPGEELRALADYARERGLEVGAKLNLSESEINCHSHWMRAPGEAWYDHFDDDYYWRTAFECIDEVIGLCRPERFFHVGMDEDHNRSCRQFVAAVRRLDAGVQERGLTTLTWSDSGIDYASGDVYVEKSERAEADPELDVVRVLWHYRLVPEAAARRIREEGKRLWCAPGWRDLAQAGRFRDLTKELGGEGILMTNWQVANGENEADLLGRIREAGAVFNG
jgi:hypothetical protein